jgi:hypothetical protein
MKTRVKFILIGVIAALSFGSWRATANLEVSAGITINSPAQFYDPLASSGVWVDVGRFGRCWHPRSVGFGWRPYCVGQWQWTDCGWYWQSDEPWAWACYHYGSWVDDPTYGWIWVPGVDWAPAWVYWRESDAYMGWAPCPPPGFSVAPSWFVFVGTANFCDPIRPSTVIVNNTTIINSTTLVRNVTRETRTIDGVSRRVFVNQGPRMDLVQRATRRSLQPVPVREVAQRTPLPQTLAPTGTDRQRLFEQPAQNRPSRERTPSVQGRTETTKPPVVPGRQEPPKDRRVTPTPNQPRTVTPPETPTGRQTERVYPQERNRPPATERNVPRQTEQPRPQGQPTGRQEQRVYPTTPANPQPPANPRVTPPRPQQPPAPPKPAPAPEQRQERDRDQQREGR